MERRGEIFIENRKENTRVIRIMSLLQLLVVEISFVLNTLLKGQPLVVYIGSRMILV